jgi:hypothetical protein
MKKMSDSELVNFVVRNMSFPNGVNSQITDAITQTLSVTIGSDEVWEQINIRRQELKRGT